MEFRKTPAYTAALYLVLGFVALFTSDVLVIALVSDDALTQQLQTLKGGLEVVLTAGFIYVAMTRHERSLRTSLAKNQARAQELAVLHRVFRHNLRNKTNIVLGHARAVKDGVEDATLRSRAETIIEQLRAISETAEQAVLIERLSFLEADRRREDVVPTLDSLVAEYEAETSAEIELSTPSAAWVWAPAHLRVAFEELLDNAVTHNDTAQCRVVVSVDPAPAGPRTCISIADNGPGIPQGTQEILESTEVDPKNHLTTFGLWTAYWIVTRAGGEFTIDEAEPRGCRIEIRLESASPAESARLSRPKGADTTDPRTEPRK